MPGPDDDSRKPASRIDYEALFDEANKEVEQGRLASKPVKDYAAEKPDLDDAITGLMGIFGFSEHASVSDLNLHPLNKLAASLLTMAGMSFNPKMELAVARLMLKVLDEDKVEPAQDWARVENFTDRHADWAELIRDLERTAPHKLIRMLVENEGEPTYLDLEGMEPDEAGATALDQLIHTMSAERVRV